MTKYRDILAEAYVNMQNKSNESIISEATESDWELSKKLRISDASSEDLHAALNHPRDAVRMAAAAHRNATADHIQKALTDQHDDVRRNAVRHPNITQSQLEIASKDPDHGVREAAFMHPNAPISMINAAFDRGDVHAMYSAAMRNPNLTKEHIDKLVNTRATQGVVLNHPDISQDQVHHIFSTTGDEDTASDALYKLRSPSSDDISKAVRMASTSRTMARAVAHHPAVTGATVVHLMHPNTANDVKNEIAQTPGIKDTATPEQLKEIKNARKRKAYHDSEPTFDRSRMYSGNSFGR